MYLSYVRKRDTNLKTTIMKLTTKPSVKLEKTIEYDIKIIEKLGGKIKEFRNYEDKFCCIIYEKEISKAGGIKPVMRYYIGTSLKPKEYYYQSFVRIEDVILNELKLIQDREEYKIKRSIEKKKAQLKNSESFSVGDIFYTSIGYSMTLVDFYEVVSKKGTFVTVRPISYKVTSGSSYEGGKKPVKGSFCGKEIRCKITQWGINIQRTAAYKTDGDTPIYFSHMD